MVSSRGLGDVYKRQDHQKPRTPPDENLGRGHAITTCTDHHFPGVACATCNDVGRLIPGRCTCGQPVNRERVYVPGQVGGWRGVWRYDYPDTQPDGYTRWVLRCRSCGLHIDDTWMPVDRPPVSLGAVTNVREV